MNRFAYRLGIVWIASATSLFACNTSDSVSNDTSYIEDSKDPLSAIELHDDFTDGEAHGWQALIRDVPEGIFTELQRRIEAGESLGPTAIEIGDRTYDTFPEETSHWLIQHGLHPLPPELEMPSKKGFLLQGNNHSDDIDKWLVREIQTAPSTKYKVTLKATFASNAQAGGFGVGGSEDLQVHVGASPIDPTPVRVDSTDHVRFPLELYPYLTNTYQTTANDLPFSFEKPFRLVTVEHAYEGESSADGSLWLMVGTHSGFESFSALYYASIEARLEPVTP